MKYFQYRFDFNWGISAYTRWFIETLHTKLRYIVQMELLREI